MKKLTKSVLILIFLITIGCGFKVVDNTNTNNFKIKEINTKGNSRINYKIKNYLLSNTKKINENILSLDMEVKLAKKVKEKNIKNEITKYEIILNTNISIFSIKKNKKNNFNLSVNGNYSVDTKNYSNTINNEKNLINNLTDKIAKNILDKINKTVNDL
tara:strand:- start:37 stop:513 length:477 start_codon:yes stop_codon:yes gene_type:complete